MALGSLHLHFKGFILCMGREKHHTYTGFKLLNQYTFFDNYDDNYL